MENEKVLEGTEAQILQIGVVVKDLEKTVDRFVGGGGLAYMGTDKIGGMIMEVAQVPAGFDPQKGIQYQETWD